MNFWEQLFSAKGPGPGFTREMLVVHRQGRPFMLLPAEPRAASTAMELYAAQTLKARVAKRLLILALRRGLKPGLATVSVHLDSDDPFYRELQLVAGNGVSPEFAIMAGNPNAPGQRFLLMLFDANCAPFAVVKAGLNPVARALIHKEAAFIQRFGGTPIGLPKVLREVETPVVSAVAFPYFPGRSPHPGELASMAPVLTSWVDAKRVMALADAPSWARLEKAAAPAFRTLVPPLRSARVCAVIEHGDFAPWNVKVSSAGQWTVLDWERGEWSGIPGWDWFHFVLQPAILVARRSTAGLIHECERMLASQPFASYASLTGVRNIARPLLLSYLLYSAEVIRPAEGLEATKALLAALMARWK